MSDVTADVGRPPRRVASASDKVVKFVPAMSSHTVVPSAPLIGFRMLFALVVGVTAFGAMMVAPGGTRPANMPADPETSATVERLQRSDHGDAAPRYDRR